MDSQMNYNNDNLSTLCGTRYEGPMNDDNNTNFATDYLDNECDCQDTIDLDLVELYVMLGLCDEQLPPTDICNNDNKLPISMSVDARCIGSAKIDDSILQPNQTNTTHYENEQNCSMKSADIHNSIFQPKETFITSYPYEPECGPLPIEINNDDNMSPDSVNVDDCTTTHYENEQSCSMESADIHNSIFQPKETFITSYPYEPECGPLPIEINNDENMSPDSVNADDCTTPEEQIESNQSLDDNVNSNTVERKRQGRPRTRPRSNKNERPSLKLWQFLLKLLRDKSTSPRLIKWVDREEGTFQFVKSAEVASLWGSRKKNGNMTYDKLSRAMRYYYPKNILAPMKGRLIYKFGPKALDWNWEE